MNNMLRKPRWIVLFQKEQGKVCRILRPVPTAECPVKPDDVFLWERQVCRNLRK